jgi:4-hydroxythreonine-4-phosphate dehydrogenase
MTTIDQPRIALTLGDPAGIGPEIVLKALLEPTVHGVAKLCVIGRKELLEREAMRCGLTTQFQRALASTTTIEIVESSVPAHEVQMGQIARECGEASYAYLESAVRLAKAGKVEAIVTGPVHKESWLAAKVPHIGHTEALSALFQSSAETLFVVDRLRIFFLTRHVSLRNAIELISPGRVVELLRHAHGALGWLGMQNPRIAVAALNPHASDGGLFGDEETTKLLPGIEAATREGIRAFGPLPADSVFHQCAEGEFDAVIALYHDQGHIAAKMRSFFGTVSVTTGLPVVRTSVDHGTAFDIAGQNRADPASMVGAIKLAAQIVHGRSRS